MKYKVFEWTHILYYFAKILRGVYSYSIQQWFSKYETFWIQLELVSHFVGLGLDGDN